MTGYLAPTRMICTRAFRFAKKNLEFVLSESVDLSSYDGWDRFGVVFRDAWTLEPFGLPLSRLTRHGMPQRDKRPTIRSSSDVMGGVVPRADSGGSDRGDP
jgi:hypothetical protein